MKIQFFIFLMASVLLLQCEPLEKNNGYGEAEQYLLEYAREQTEEADAVLERCKRVGAVPFDVDIQTVSRLSAQCQRFNHIADSVANSIRFYAGANADDNRHTFRFIDSLYRITVDSIRLWHSEEARKIRPGNYDMSKHAEALPLTLARMQYEISDHVNAIVSTLDRKIRGERTRQRDDSGLSTAPYMTDSHQYSFSVNSKFIQQFPYREIMIDSILMNGKPARILPLIGSRDMIRVMELQGLKKGKYTVKIGIGDRYFTHKFQIRK